jgi:parvulin-like peptidyl-prolyl isomerase
MPTRRGHALILSLLLLLLSAAAVLLGWQYHLRQQTTIARIGPTTITRQQLALALRQHLWQHQLHWSTLAPPRQNTERQYVLDQLIQAIIIEPSLPLGAADETRAQTEAEHRFQQFTKQFEGADTWQTRANTQHLNETQLRQQLLQEARHAIAIENHLAKLSDPPTESQARAYFAQHPNHFVVPESAHASHLFLTIHDKDRPHPEPEIRAYHQQLISNQATLPALASQHSDDPRTQKTGGDLGWFSRDRAPADFAEIVFNLNPGQLSPPFLTKLGWHIVKLHEKRPSRPATFDEVKTEILAQLQTQHRQTALQNWLTRQQKSIPIQIHTDRLQTIDPAPFQ